MKSFCLAVSIFLLHFALASCDGDEERYEIIQKLRAVGVETTPIAAQPSTATAPQIVNLNFYLIQPDNKALSAENYVDGGSKYAGTVDLTINPTQADPTELNGLFLHTVAATFTVPPEEALKIPDEPGFLRLRYGLKIFSAEEEQKVVGNILVYKADDPKVNWKQPTVDLLQPTDGETVAPGDVEIKAKIDSDYEEDWRVAWFATDGKILNRRAKETKWETPGEGDHSLIVTVRGLNSNGFVIKTAKVKFE